MREPHGERPPGVAEQLTNRAVRYPDRHFHRLTRRRALAIHHLHSADRSVTDLLQRAGDPFVAQGQMAARRFQRMGSTRLAPQDSPAEERQWRTSTLDLEDRRR